MGTKRIEAKYIDDEFLGRCVREFNNVCLRKNMGQDPNALELFAITVLEKYITKEYNLKSGKE